VWPPVSQRRIAVAKFPTVLAGCVTVRCGHGNAARALRALEPEAQVASRAVEIARQRFHDHHGNRLGEVDVAELWAAVGPCLALHRADLHALPGRRRKTCSSVWG
jgi:hypothetical protein